LGVCRVAGGDHEPSHCRHGVWLHAVWLHAGRMFYNDAEPGFHEVGCTGRVAGHRVRTVRGRSKDLVGAELSYPVSALGSARSRILRDACTERLPAADRVGTSGGGRRNCCCATPRAQPSSCGPAGSGTAKEASCEEKEARGGSGPSSSDRPHGRSSAHPRVHPSACLDVGARPSLGALNPDGDGTIRDQLSLAVAIAGRAIYRDGWMANTVPAVIPCVTAPPSRSKSSW